MAIKMSEEEYKAYGLDRAEEKERSKEKEEYINKEESTMNNLDRANKEINNRCYNEEQASKNKKAIVKLMFIVGTLLVLFNINKENRRLNEEIRNIEYETLMSEITELRERAQNNTSEATTLETVDTIDTSDKVYIVNGTYYDYLVLVAEDGTEYYMTEDAEWVQNGKVIFDDGEQLTATVQNGEVTGILRK